MPRRRRLSRKARRGLIRSAVELARGFFVSEHGREPTAREIAGRLNTDTKLLADIVGRRRSVRESDARYRDRIRELDRLAADYFGREIGDITNLSSDDCDAMRRGAGSHDARPRPRTAFPDPGTKTAEP